jgi:hypothetical protein
MNRTVLPWAVMPAQWPVQTTALAYLLLDRWSAAGWVWGVVGTVLALFWVLAVVRMYTDKQKPLAGYGTDAK